jgi:hypothetical protein
MINLMLVPFGLFGLFVGAAVLIAGDGGEVWWLYVGFLVSGVLMLWGAASNLVRWWRWQRNESAAAAAMAAAVRAHSAPPAGPSPATPVMHPGVPSPAPPATHPGLPPVKVVAHWTYEPEEWRAYAEREVSHRGGEAFWLFVAVTLVGTPLVWQESRSWGISFAISLLLGAVVGGLRLLIARAAHAQNVTTPRGEVVITPTAILMNGSYQVIQDHHFRFRSARVIEDERPPILEIGIEWPTRSGRATEEYRIPIPAGREDEARAIAHEFNTGYAVLNAR